MPHAGGRPSKYSQELADRICEQLASGQSMRTVCKADDMPSMQSVFTWLRTYPKFLEQYARAKEEASDAFVEQMLDIADSSTTEVQRDRLRVDTRKWIASKLKPKKYGDRLNVESPDGTMTPQVIIESVYANRPKFRTSNKDAEAPEVAAESSAESG